MKETDNGRKSIIDDNGDIITPYGINQYDYKKYI